MRVEFSRRAADQVAAIVAHVADNDPAAADRIARRVEAAAAGLADFPESGKRATTFPGLRWIVIPGLPYLLFYTIRPSGTVRIVRVLHAARQRRRP
ncbi:type II toxin-antitoxin system RelE/ParE family toxin [Salinarimonas soli]|uniref:Type II toxin-antitoxin system RelE/ParE family toxin n=1 Tax=Salinarimonas soli TaxID=1638099 RepID=A0A5B2VE01_9HYPH|nr:type II toxin-antitoxin system RelE/ParE family toxin [Salinarimonas soli]KAA2236367.1 type II toxin-antitoxin system RelE/ParE family toxin [Salinarimonas soli]